MAKAKSGCQTEVCLRERSGFQREVRLLDRCPVARENDVLSEGNVSLLCVEASTFSCDFNY